MNYTHIRLDQLEDILNSLAHARPDLVEALALVAIAAGVKPPEPRIVVEMPESRRALARRSG